MTDTASPASNSPASAPARPSLASLARAQVLRARHGTLCTLDRDDGTPYGSFVEVLPQAEDGSVVLLLSTPAEHTRNALEDGRASFVTGDAWESPYPQMAARVTLLGRLERMERTDALRDAYLALHPRAAEFVDFGDFDFWVLRPSRVRFIAGFGRMNWQTATDYAAAEPDMMWLSAPGVVSHMNEDHRDNLLDMVRAFAEQGGASDAVMLGLDRHGFDVAAVVDGHPHGVRLSFDAPLEHPRQVRQAMVTLAHRARAALGGPDA